MLKRWKNINEFQENLKINLKKSPEELLKNRLTNVLIGQIQIIKDDITVTPEEKYVQSNMVFNMLTFLQDYNCDIKRIEQKSYEER